MARPTDKARKLKVGDTYLTKNYGLMEILNDNGSRDVTIKFIDTGCVRDKINRGNVVRGQVKDTTVKTRGHEHREVRGVRTYNSYLKLIDSRKGWAKYECTLCGSINMLAKKYSEYNIPLSCGCYQKLKPPKDYTGEVIKGCLFIGYNAHGKWLVEYPCGCRLFKTHSSVVKRASWKCNACREHISPSTIHNATSGGTNTKEYNSWCSMRRRCYSPSNNRYEYYGERGITVCDEWRTSFPKFLSDMGECPEGYSLERLDLGNSYTKDNCIWGDDITQANNKTNNI